MAQITTATAGDVVRDKRVMITANKSNTIAEVLDIMLKKKVLTVPVFDSVQSRHYSMLSMHRIIGFILNFDHGSGDSVDVGRLNKNVDELISLTLADAVFEEFDEKAPFDEILAALAKGTFNRAMVKTGEECRLLTHTDAASFLLQTPEKIPTGSIKDFGFLCSVTTCSDRETGLACFRKLHRAQLSACPIVNRDGAVIGNISTSDMRNIDPMHFNGIMLKTVAVNVLDFLRVSVLLSSSAGSNVCRASMVGKFLPPSRVRRLIRWLT